MLLPSVSSRCSLLHGILSQIPVEGYEKLLVPSLGKYGRVGGRHVGQDKVQIVDCYGLMGCLYFTGTDQP
jgi:hypothetical protein